jgi:bleomycin hydrolase
MKKQLVVFFLVIILALPSQAGNPDKPEKSSGNYNFKTLVDLKATTVKDQASTGTCWCFATTSFIESELIRMGKGEYDLSEMWIVRNNYSDKLRDNFVQKGKGNLGEGSLGHDWMIEFVKNGVVPDEVYPGLNYGTTAHNHNELNDFINAIGKVPVERNRETDQYFKLTDALLDIYLGTRPSEFIYKGINYSPESFTKSLGINPDDYVEITSFTHFPFYTQGLVPVPDNWRKVNFYNVPLDELIEIVDYSLNNGFTLSWDGDVSEKGFSHRNGIAVIPATGNGRNNETRKNSGTRSKAKSDEDSSSKELAPEMSITQEFRQKEYENKSTTDDHLMHITGIAKDQNGTKYYITKNSWGTDRNPFGGYLNMSENYVRAKTITIMVHKDGIPQAIRTKLGI